MNRDLVLHGLKLQGLRIAAQVGASLFFVLLAHHEALVKTMEAGRSARRSVDRMAEWAIDREREWERKHYVIMRQEESWLARIIYGGRRDEWRAIPAEGWQAASDTGDGQPQGAEQDEGGEDCE